MMRFATPIMIVGLISLVVGCGRGPDPDGSGKGIAQDEAEELAAAEGAWVAEKVDAPDGVNVPPPDTLSAFTGTIKGNLLTLDLPNPKFGGGRTEYVALRLKPSASPKQVDMIATDHTGTTEPKRYDAGSDRGTPVVREIQRDRFAGIYKMEGDILVVAIATEPGGPRPTEFRSSPKRKGVTVAERSGVIVVYLKKKS
jgi:uncharacterized protein (TIGR03067 family)